MTFGQMLKGLIKEAGVTQARVAERIGVSESLLSQIISDSRTPPLDKIEALADLLKVDGAPRALLIQTAKAAHSHSDLVQSFHDRGRLIDRINLRLKAYEELITGAETADEKALRAQLATLTKEQLVDRMVIALRANRKRMLLAPQGGKRRKL